MLNYLTHHKISQFSIFPNQTEKTELYFRHSCVNEKKFKLIERFYKSLFKTKILGVPWWCSS